VNQNNKTGAHSVTNQVTLGEEKNIWQVSLDDLRYKLFLLEISVILG